MEIECDDHSGLLHTYPFSFENARAFSRFRPRNFPKICVSFGDRFNYIGYVWMGDKTLKKLLRLLLNESEYLWNRAQCFTGRRDRKSIPYSRNRII